LDNDIGTGVPLNSRYRSCDEQSRCFEKSEETMPFTMPVESGIATSLVITLVLHSDHRSSIGLANVRAKSKARVASQARIPTADCATAE